jgi:alkylation response protein AidB-like acyl-CoA dehydrogenase
VGAVNEPTPLDKAEAAAREAADNTDLTRVVAAVLATQHALQQQAPQQAPAPQCQHDHRKDRRGAAEWIGIACAVCVGGVGIAFASLALAILGGVAAIVVLVLRDMWRDFQKKH